MLKIICSLILITLLVACDNGEDVTKDEPAFYQELVVDIDSIAKLDVHELNAKFGEPINTVFHKDDKGTVLGQDGSYKLSNGSFIQIYVRRHEARRFFVIYDTPYLTAKEALKASGFDPDNLVLEKQSNNLERYIGTTEKNVYKYIEIYRDNTTKTWITLLAEVESDKG